MPLFQTFWTEPKQRCKLSQLQRSKSSFHDSLQSSHFPSWAELYLKQGCTTQQINYLWDPVFNLRINYPWITTTCQQRPLFFYPKFFGSSCNYKEFDHLKTWQTWHFLTSKILFPIGWPFNKQRLFSSHLK